MGLGLIASFRKSGYYGATPVLGMLDGIQAKFVHILITSRLPRLLINKGVGEAIKDFFSLLNETILYSPYIICNDL